ncbi:uncharacterized protein LOC130666018 isoform X2 [Microplitis mediator]|uniref:uncharacterized protein LOC130666018 isoform X2 n=1 Tax=Microplitis mediator TaxID=375433 RepID=UPI002557284A|nr:uncharacterized protein LOC130666018 isoform X2 [Microplitis mediator]
MVNYRIHPSRINIFNETFHTIGIALMIFEVLPKLNYNYCVLFVIWCVIEWGLHAAMSAFCEMKSTKIKSWLIFVDIVCLGIFINFTIFNPFDGINRNNTDCWIAMLALALLHCGLWQDDSYSTFNLTDYLPPFINSHRILEPVKDSIYAWVSLWKIIVFFASSFAIFVINHGTTTHLFEMFGPALSLDNTTEIIPRQEVDFNDPQYRNELNLIIRLLFPVMILSFQLTMALFINKRTESVITSILDRFISPSIMGLSIPLLITIEFILFSGYFRSVNYYLLYRIPLGEQLTNLFSDIHIPDVVSKFISIDSLYNWDANLLRLSFCWIVLHFIVVVYGADVIDCYYKYYDDETLVIVKVEVIPKNEKVEEKENLTAV